MRDWHVFDLCQELKKIINTLFKQSLHILNFNETNGMKYILISMTWYCSHFSVIVQNVNYKSTEILLQTILYNMRLSIE